MLIPSSTPTGVRGRADACPGTLALHRSDDGWLARVRVPGGQLSATQAAVLGSASAMLGDGNLELTSRGNIQIRGLRADAGPELAAQLSEAQMLPSPVHDKARNIVASPLSGVDKRGHLDVSSLVREVDTLLCGTASLTSLSGRFLIGLDDGRGDVLSLNPDVALCAYPDGLLRLRLASTDTAVGVTRAEAASLLVHAAAAFLSVRRELGSDAWRIAELPGAVPRILAALSPQFGPSGRTPPSPANTSPPPLGIVAGVGRTSAVSVVSRLGRVHATQWQTVTELTATSAGSLRLTPWRGVVIPGVSDAEQALAALTASGFVTGNDSPWAGSTACTGLPGCRRSLTDVRADADAVLRQTAAHTPAAGQVELPVHFSGCERRCGRPATRHVEVVATPEGTTSVYHLGIAGEPTAAVTDDTIADAVASARRTR